MESVDAGLLHDALMRAGFPVVGVRMKEADRATWTVELDRSATPDQVKGANDFVAAFDPQGADVKNTEEEIAAEGLANSRNIRAFFLWYFRVTHKRDPLPEEVAEAEAQLVQAYKDTPEVVGR